MIFSDDQAKSEFLRLPPFSPGYMNFLSSVPSIVTFMRFNGSKVAGGDCSRDFAGMDAPANAPLAGIVDDFLEQLFYRHATFSGSDSSGTMMSLWLDSGELSDIGGGGGGLDLVFNLGERKVFATLEEGDGSKNKSLEEANVKPYTEGETLVQLPKSMSLEFGHVQSYQIRPNYPPRQVLHKQTAERGSEPPVPSPKLRTHSIAERANGKKRTKQQVWERKWSNECTDRKVAKLMEEAIGTAMDFLQPKALCKMSISLTTLTYSHIQSSESSTLKPPEPNAPL